jgi:hypothetical protein
MTATENDSSNKRARVDHLDEGAAVHIPPRKVRGLIAPGLKLYPTNRQDCRHTAKRFKCCLSIHNIDSIPTSISSLSDTLILDALVLDNKVVVFVLPFPLANVQRVEFASGYDFSVADVSGKFKKGAKIVAALDTLITVYVASSLSGELQRISLKAPMAGKIVEINDLLPDSPALLSSHPRSDGYIAVVTSEVPELLEGPENDIDLTAQKATGRSKDKICFGWVKGGCRRGNACKFKHTERAGVTDEQL